MDAEANLQAEFYHACRLLNVPVALEIVTPAGRLDAAILNAAKTHILAIIEVKRDERQYGDGESFQIKRYKALGAPVHGLWHGKDPHKLAATLKAQYASAIGVSLVKIKSMKHLKGFRKHRLAEYLAETSFDSEMRENLLIK